MSLLQAPQGLITFPGIVGVRSASFPFKDGIAPSFCTIRAPFQPGPFPKIGTVTLSYGAVVMQFPNCRLIDITVETGTDGKQMLAFRIADRRWKWAFGWIEGRYNRRPLESLGWEKTPIELATLCFEAMGEKKANCVLLPDESRPDIDWCGVPAEQLTRLVSPLGCRIVLDYKSNTAKLWPLGVGIPMPYGPIEADTVTIDPPEFPDAFRIVGGETQLQMELELEPVVEEVGLKTEIVELEKASFKPPGGFTVDALPTWPNVVEKYREHAQAQVYRYWRPKVPFKDYGYQIDGLDAILPLRDHLVNSAKINENYIENGPAELFGTWWSGEPELESSIKWLDTTHGKQAQYKRGFQIDRDRGLVITSEPLVRIVDGAGKDIDIGTSDLSQCRLEPAKLWLRVAVNVRDGDTNSFVRYKRDTIPPGKKLGLGSVKKGKKATEPMAHHIRRDDLFLRRWRTAMPSGAMVEKSNQTQLDNLMTGYLLEEINKWQMLTPGTRVLAGFIPVSIDGAIRQVTWFIDDTGFAKTQVSRNREEPNIGLTSEQIREIEILQWVKRTLESSGDSDVRPEKKR